MPGLPPTWTAVAEALLIGLLIGVQRETVQGDRRPGLRDFLVIALAGALCGLLQQPALTVAALATIVVFTTIYYLRATERGGITTEFVVLATFLLCYLTTAPDLNGPPLSIALTIGLVFALETKSQLHRFVRESLTQFEFRDTLRFLAIIFIIYPLLPEGAYGPYEFFSPRRVWLFVILVSSISYLGYFAQKLLGPDRGLVLTAIFGGLASTTAATAALARNYREDPERLTVYWQAAALANAIQFPRIWAILLVVNAGLAARLLPVLAVMTAIGIIKVLLLARMAPAEAGQPAPKVNLGNPFRLAPALRFGALFAVIQLGSRWAFSIVGSASAFTTVVAGALDVDAIALSLAEFNLEGRLSPDDALVGILLALTANAAVKTGIAWFGGGPSFAIRLASSFLLMLLTGAGVLGFLL